jgi:DNA-binding XRE family transcriptional regulator
MQMLAQQLYELRRKQGLSQEQLAERIGVSRQTVSKWEGGQSTPDLERLLALAECYGISLDELVGKAPPSHQTPPPPLSPQENRFSRIAGLCMCLLGIVCIVLAVVIVVIDPQAGQSVATSVAVTIDGFGVVYGISALAVVVGVYLMIRKP